MNRRLLLPRRRPSMLARARYYRSIGLNWLDAWKMAWRTCR